MAEVEYVKLGDVCSIKTGEMVSKTLIEANKGPYPVINSGRTPLGFINSYNTDNDPIGIASRGSVGLISWNPGRYFRGNLNYSCSVLSEELLIPRFLYFLLKTKQIEIDRLATHEGIPALNKSNLETLEIPLPPVEKQQEIVDILDKFTSLTASLTAEKELRVKQYHYYRNLLLTFKQDMGKDLVKLVSLGDIGHFIRGSGLQKKDFTEEGVGCIHYGQIYTYYGTYADKTKSFVSSELAKKLKKAAYGDLVIASTSENVEDVCKCVAWLGEEDICISGDSYIFKHNQNPKYLAYYFQTPAFADFKARNATGTKVIRVNSSSMEKFKILLPPLSEQKRIVAILDKFDSYVNDITCGLPAEIAARQKQYEYYRNKLLSFDSH